MLVLLVSIKSYTAGTSFAVFASKFFVESVLACRWCVAIEKLHKIISSLPKMQCSLCCSPPSR
jgi:hypothetical protein